MYAIALVTCPDVKCAERIAELILRKRLAACVNIIKGVRSLFRWKGRVEKASEALMIIKTSKNALMELEEAVKENHPYDLPEFIALHIENGSREYLEWVGKELSA